MAIYHCSIKIIGRSKGRSAVACAAYRSGEKLRDEETGQLCDYTKKGGVVYSEIILPENAPVEYMDRETLWNEVQRKEKNKNAQLAREIEVAIPAEFKRDLQIKVVQDYVKNCFVSKGMCADFSLHDKGDGNPHAHIMLTTRGIKEDGTWDVKERKEYALDENGERIPMIDKKTGKQKLGRRNEKIWKRITVEANDWNSKDRAEEWRSAWADICNNFLDETQRIDHRSYKRQGLDTEPTIHEGFVARDMEKKGRESVRCRYNRTVKALNEVMSKLKEFVVDKPKELIAKGVKSISEKEAMFNDRINEFINRRKHNGDYADQRRDREGESKTEERSAGTKGSECRTDTESFIRNTNAEIRNVVDAVNDSGIRAKDSGERRRNSEAKRKDRDLQRMRPDPDRERSYERPRKRSRGEER